MNLGYFIRNLPEVAAPTEKKLNFNTKLKWTLIILVAYFVLENIPLFGLAKNSLERFEFLAIIFGTSFGSVISLGIGPIVIASIILQLLVGSKIIPWDLKTEEGKKKFQGVQKLLVIFFCLFEAYTFVAFGAIQPINNEPGLMIAVVLQIAFGGFLVLYGGGNAPTRILL